MKKIDFNIWFRKEYWEMSLGSCDLDTKYIISISMVINNKLL